MRIKIIKIGILLIGLIVTKVSFAAGEATFKSLGLIYTPRIDALGQAYSTLDSEYNLQEY
jgi:hypothetical protein